VTIFKIVNTDNFNGDYPNEKFVENLPVLYKKEHAQAIADAINATQSEMADRYFNVVEDGYKLQPGFAP
jgi:hypothetical protein